MSPQPHWAGRNPDPNPSGDGGGGATTLTGLTDVTGTPGPGKSPVDDGTTTFPLTRVTTQEDLQAILDQVAAVTWFDLALADGITNAADDPAVNPDTVRARCRLTLNNLVYVEAVLKCDPPLANAQSGRVLATLPPETWPGARLIFLCGSSGQNPAEIDVLADGTIVFETFFGGTANAEMVTLCGISFSIGGPTSIVTDALAQTFG